MRIAMNFFSALLGSIMLTMSSAESVSFTLWEFSDDDVMTRGPDCNATETPFLFCVGDTIYATSNRLFKTRAQAEDADNHTHVGAVRGTFYSSGYDDNADNPMPVITSDFVISISDQSHPGYGSLAIMGDAYLASTCSELAILGGTGSNVGAVGKAIFCIYPPIYSFEIEYNVPDESDDSTSAATNSLTGPFALLVVFVEVIVLMAFLF